MCLRLSTKNDEKQVRIFVCWKDYKYWCHIWTKVKVSIQFAYGIVVWLFYICVKDASVLDNLNNAIIMHWNMNVKKTCDYLGMDAVGAQDILYMCKILPPA